MIIWDGDDVMPIAMVYILDGSDVMPITIGLWWCQGHFQAQTNWIVMILTMIRILHGGDVMPIAMLDVLNGGDVMPIFML